MSEFDVQRDRLEQHHKRHIVFDLDGVILRWPSAHTPNHADQAAFDAMLPRIHEVGTTISILTNRPPGHMQAIAYRLGLDSGWFVTESGGSVYDVATHKASVAPQWLGFAQDQVPRLRSELVDRGLVSAAPASADVAQFEPGMGYVKTVVLPPAGISLDEYGKRIQEVADAIGPDEFDVKVGKAIDVDPKGLSKVVGIKSVLDLNGVDPSQVPTIFIADAKRDVEAGRWLMEQGGYVGVVGNADGVFANAFRENDRAIYAPPTTEYFSSVAKILTTFHDES